MNREIKLRDFHKRIVGYIQYLDNGDQLGLDFYRRKVGIYKKQFNITTKWEGECVGNGNLLVGLIYQEAQK